MSCSLCEGTLVQRTTDEKGWAVQLACPACLSTPATDGPNGIRQVACAWLGFSLWADHQKAPGHWWTPDDSGKFRAVLPAYLPAGFDLGCRVLATRLGVSSQAQVYFRAIPGGCFTWMLGACVAGESVQVWYFNETGPRDGDRHPYIFVAGIAGTPVDAPPALRAARALVLALEAT